MKQICVRLGFAVALLAAAASPSFAVTINPTAIGAPQGPFDANLVDFSYSATVKQTGPVGCSPSCSFTESGTGSFSNWKVDFTTPVINSGLNQSPGYLLTGQFNAAGTATPGTSGSINVTFSSFNFDMFAQTQPGGVITKVATTDAFLAGQAHVFGPDLAKGDFHIVLNLKPVGGFFSSNFILNADFAGNNTFIQGVSLGPFTGGSIQGSGDLTLRPIPEPSSLLLLGSGLVSLGWLARRRYAV